MKLENQIILLTGGSGVLGRFLTPRLREQGAVVIAPSSKDMDITDTSKTFQAVSWHNPDLVVHCAAYTNVPEAENAQGRLEANKVNIYGSKNIIEASHYFGAKVVYISTEYVYDGTGDHYEGDKTKPITYYGMTKLIGESFTSDQDLILRLCFKNIGTWGPNAYTKVPHPVKTNADFVDVIADKIIDAITRKMTGVVNLGTKAKYLMDLAVQEYPEVNITDVRLLNTTYKYPRNGTMRLDI